MGVHETAAKGFERGAEEYERGRPSYPAEAVRAVVDEFGIGPSSTIVDVGAGTGKWTRLLTSSGARVVAVEPVAGMREVFGRVLPDVDLREGTAESLRLDDASVDVLTAAQTYHWVDAVPAVAEAARVVRPGGGIAFLWNSRDTSVPWAAAIKALMDRVAGGEPRYGSASGGGWQQAMEDHPAFGELRRLDFRHDHPTSLEHTLARVSSTSYVSALDDAARDAVLDEVRAIVRDAQLGDTFTDPYLVEVWLCHRV